MVEKVRRAEREAVGPSHRRLEAVAGLQPRRHLSDILLPRLVWHRSAKRPGEEVSQQSIRVVERPLAAHGPYARDGIWLVVGLVRAEPPGRHPLRWPHAGMIGGLELDQRQVSEQPHMAFRGP